MAIVRKIALAVALLCLAPATAHVAALETSGEFRVRGWRLDNYFADGKTTEFWDQRLRLLMTWPVADHVQLEARADILAGLWGYDNQIGTPAPGAGARRQITFDRAAMQFVVPRTPLRLTAGRFDVSWGTGFWVQSDDRDRIEVAAKLDPVVVVLAYDKLTEVFMGHDTRDDQRGWAIGAAVDAAGFRFGLLAAYLKDGSRTRFPAGDFSYLAGDCFAKGKIGPAAIQAELNVGSGRIDRGAMGDLDAGGLGWYAAVFLPVGPSLTLGLEGAYARGDDPKTPGTVENMFSSDYQGPYWSVIFYNNMDYSGYAGDGQSSSTDLDFGVRNAVTGKLSAVFTPTRKLSLTVAGLYAAADQAKAGVDKGLGWEFDVIAAYAITENVSLTAGAGYAVLGDYWKSAPIAGPGGRRPDNPLGILVAFTTRF